MSDPKQLKFQFVVDEASLAKTRGLIRELIADLTKLNAEAGKAGGIGGLGGGGGVSVSGGARQSPEQQRVIAKTAPAGRGLVQGFLDQKQIFKGIADGSKDAMKVMTDSLRRATADQLREVSRLEKALGSLDAAYKRLGGASGPHGNQIMNKAMQIQGRLNGARGNLADLQGMGGPWPGPRDDMPQGAAPQSGFARFRGALNSGGGLGAQEVNSAGLSKIPGIGQYIGGAGGMPFVMATAAAALGVKAALSQAGAAWNNQSISGQARADYGRDGPSSYARKLRGGDLSDIRAMNDIESDQDKKREYDEIQNPEWFRRQVNRVGAAKDAFGERGFKEGFSELFEGTDGASYQKNLRQRQREKINMTIEERGVLEDIDADATSGAGGKMSQMRALGIGDGRKKTGAYRSNAERFLLNYSQFDPGEVTGAVQGIAGSGTRGAAYSGGLLSSVLQAQGAGINGAAGMGGIMSRQGGASGTNFMNLLRSMPGDVSTVGMIGQAVTQHSDQMNTAGFNGAGMLGALGYGTTGSDGAMVARQNLQGQGEFQRLLGGGRDAAQQAQNLLVAKKAAPGAGFYAQQYLATKLDAGRMEGVLAGTDALTPEERNMGITQEMKRQTVLGMRHSRAFRSIAGGFAAGSDPQKMLAAMQGGADVRDVGQQMFGHRDKKGGLVYGAAERAQATSSYASILMAGDNSLSQSAAEGTARLELFGLGRKGTQGKMRGDVAGGSFEAKVAKDAAERRVTDVDLKDASMDRLEAEQHTADAYKRLVTNSSNLAITADNIASIIKVFSLNLKNAANGGSNSSNAKSKPK